MDIENGAGAGQGEAGTAEIVTTANQSQSQDRRPGRGRPATRKLSYTEQGARLKTLLEEKGFTTLGEVAEATGLSVSMVSKLRAGETVPSEATLVTLGRALGEEAVRAIGWPKAYSPLSYARPSKAAPAGSVGAVLKELRLALPGPPDQDEMALLLGVKPRVYRYVETGGGQRQAAALLERMHQYIYQQQHHYPPSHSPAPIPVPNAEGMDADSDEVA